MSQKRVPIIADGPTTGEQDLPGVEARGWNPFFLPKGTPEPIVRRLNKAMNDMLHNPAYASAWRTSARRSFRRSTVVPNTSPHSCRKRSSGEAGRSAQPASARVGAGRAALKGGSDAVRDLLSGQAGRRIAAG